MVMNRNTFISMLIVFFGAAGGTLCSVYSSTLFLSNYPTDWLPYFLITGAICNALTSFVATPLLINNIKRNAILILNSCALFVLVGCFITISTIFWMPFVLAILIGVVNTFISVVGWNVVPLAFGLREYKQALIPINKAAAVGGIIGSFQIPILLKFYSLSSLLIFLFIFLLGSSVAIYFLTFIKQPKIENNHSINLMNFSLYRNFLIFFACLVAVLGLSDYVFKFELGNQFTQDQIGIFMGSFIGVCNVLGLFVALTISKRMLQFLRVDGLLFITPAVMFLCCIAILIYPSLLTVCLLASTKILFFYNHARLSQEVVLNILPSAVRTAAKSQLKSVVTSGASIGIFLLLLVIANYFSLRGIVALTAFFCAVCLYYVNRISVAYKYTLQQETEFKRFNFVEQMNPTNEKVFTDIITRALKSKDNNDVLFGVSTLNKMNVALPEVIYQQLNNPDPIVRKAIIGAIQKHPSADALEPLSEQFEIEKDPELKFRLLDVISELNYQAATTVTKHYLTLTPTSAYSNALNIFLRIQDLSQRHLQVEKLRVLARDPNDLVRKEAAYIIGKYQLTDLENELALLIEDPNNDVSNTAIKAAGEAKFTNLIDTIVNQLKPGPRAHSARYALIMYGQLSIPSLVKAVKSPSRNYLPVKVMAAIPGDESEQALVKIAAGDSIYLRTLVAKEVNYRASQQVTSQVFRDKAQQLALQEAYTIAYLQKLAIQHTSLAVQTEIASRITLAKQRALQWLAVGTSPILINRLIPSLLMSNQSLSYQQAYAKALELLELYIEDPRVKRTILNVFEGVSHIKVPTKFVYSDQWLETVIHSQTNPEDVTIMDELLIVFNLRKVVLFKNLPGEILLAIAEETKEMTFNEGDVIFNENDSPDGLYCICSGEVRIIRHGQLLKTLKAPEFFGELALMDDTVRAASAVAGSDCSLLFLEKTTFDRMTDDLPEVLREVTKGVLNYLRQNN